MTRRDVRHEEIAWKASYGTPRIYWEFSTEVAAPVVAGLAKADPATRLTPVVLVSGHTNTIPQIIQAFGGGTIAPIDESDFGNMFIVTASGSSATVVKLRYGVIE